MSATSRLRTSSSDYLGKCTANDYFHQDCCSRIREHQPGCDSIPSTARLLGGIFQNVRNSMMLHCQTC
ncbi:hypothetical protein TNCV_3019891 [Trichonephila clavipes]|nr:hypothetical protein TNCV_3019891 [Trichonephila clavipes]